MDYTRRCLMLLLALVVLCASHTARAGKVVTYYLDDLGGSLLVVTSPQKVTRVRFSAPVMDAYAASSLVSMRLEYEKDEVRLRPTEFPKEPIIGNIQVDVWDSPKIALDVRVSRNPTDAFDIVNIIRRDAKDVRISELEQQTEQLKTKHEQEDKERELETQKHMRKLKRNAKLEKERAAEQAFAAQLWKKSYLMPTPSSPVPNEEKVTLSIGAADWRGMSLGVAFETKNGGLKPFKVGEVRVRDGNGKRIEHRPFFNAASRDGAIIIHPGGRLEGTVILPGAAKARLAPLSIEITEATGLSSISAVVPQWNKQPILPFMVPMTEEQVQDERERGRKTLSLQAIYGVTWLDDATPGTEDLGATDIKGFGARLNYGFNRYLALEADGMYASTGEAEFDGGSRSAKMGRIQLGGLLRLGSGRYVPGVRGAVGLQGASYTGVGDRFEFNLTWSIGAGLDVNLGSFVFGLALSGGQLVSSDSRSLQAAAYGGVSWK